MTFRFAVASIVALFLAAPVAAQGNVRRLFAGIETSAGRPVLDITASEFHLTENGVERRVLRAGLATTPMRIVLLVDASASATPFIPDFREALAAFVDALAPEHEVVLASVSGQMRLRVAPTTDRARIHSGIANFSADGGGSTLVAGILEADRRFLRNTDRWPVFVVLTTDTNGPLPVQEFDAFFKNFAVRAGSAHAIVVRSARGGDVNTDVARAMASNGHGVYERLAVTNSLSERLKLIAARLTSDHRAMAQRYELEYESGTKANDVSLELSVDRRDAIVIVSSRRPF